MPDPIRGLAFTFSLGLVETAARPNFKANPTLAAGDFKVSIDGGALNNLTTLPTVAPASSRNVEVALSASEMNGDRIVVQAVDAAGAEWDEAMVTILTTGPQLDRSSRTIGLGTVGVGSSTTSIVTSSLLPAASVTDQFKNRIVIFDKDTTTANLRGQAAAITASTSGGVLTVTTLTTAPASGDTFAIL